MLRTEPIHEAYSFVCLRCGHAWEGAFEIRHSTDGPGHVRADYYVNSLKVPSPLTANRCRVCRSRRIRISGPVECGQPARGTTDSTADHDEASGRSHEARDGGSGHDDRR